MTCRWTLAATAAIAFVTVGTPARAEPVVSHPACGVRALDGGAQAVLDRALERSATVRQLVAAISAHDGLVHVESVSRYRLVRAGLLGATSHAITFGGGIRIVRVSIVTDRGDAVIATLGHELQHVNEILSSDARDRAAVDALYERIGVKIKPGVFETPAAQETTDRIARELKRR